MDRLETRAKLNPFEEMVQGFIVAASYADRHNVNIRAAYMLAIDRVAFTIKERGVYA